MQIGNRRVCSNTINYQNWNAQYDSEIQYRYVCLKKKLLPDNIRLCWPCQQNQHGRGQWQETSFGVSYKEYVHDDVIAYAIPCIC